MYFVSPWLTCTFKDGKQVYGGIQCTVDGLKISNSNSQIKFYPNPSSGKFFIENTMSMNLQKLELYSISGRKIQELNSNSKSFDVGFLDAGIYYLRYEVDKESYFQKIVLE